MTCQQRSPARAPSSPPTPVAAAPPKRGTPQATNCPCPSCTPHSKARGPQPVRYHRDNEVRRGPESHRSRDRNRSSSRPGPSGAVQPCGAIAAGSDACRKCPCRLDARVARYAMPLRVAAARGARRGRCRGSRSICDQHRRSADRAHSDQEETKRRR